MEQVKELDQEYRNGDSGVKYMLRGPEMEWGIILLKPSQTMGCHLHNRVEETFYVLEGTPTLIVDGKETLAQPQTGFRIPAPEKHDWVNSSNNNAKILFIKAPYDPKDKQTC